MLQIYLHPPYVFMVWRLYLHLFNSITIITIYLKRLVNVLCILKTNVLSRAIHMYSVVLTSGDTEFLVIHLCKLRITAVTVIRLEL
jgi:hypothetical protein